MNVKTVFLGFVRVECRIALEMTFGGSKIRCKTSCKRRMELEVASVTSATVKPFSFQGKLFDCV